MHLVDEVASGAGLLVELEVVPGLQQLPAAWARCLTNIIKIQEQCGGSGSGIWIQCFFDHWIRDGKIRIWDGKIRIWDGKIRIRDPE
jgi:hypothetical protein